ncbi:MAG: hypothetical protein H5U33_16220, partial [Pseudomonas sp.]|nr:hypothetical protein [Pseudomonas sp.]
MLAVAQPLSATRQNLWRLTFIRILVLAAQAGSVGVAYWTELQLIVAPQGETCVGAADVADQQGLHLRF